MFGKLTLKSPVLAASGTFGYAKEMDGVVELARLGGIVPKTVGSASGESSAAKMLCNSFCIHLANFRRKM